jgi:hypothetical protein
MSANTQRLLHEYVVGSMPPPLSAAALTPAAGADAATLEMQSKLNRCQARTARRRLRPVDVRNKFMRNSGLGRAVRGCSFYTHVSLWRLCELYDSGPGRAKVYYVTTKGPYMRPLLHTRL